MEKTDDAFLTSSLTSVNQGQGLLNQLILFTDQLVPRASPFLMPTISITAPLSLFMSIIFTLQPQKLGVFLSRVRAGCPS